MRGVLFFFIGIALGVVSAFYVNDLLLVKSDNNTLNSSQYVFTPAENNFAPEEQPIIKQVQVNVGNEYDLVINNMEIETETTLNKSDFINIEENTIKIKGLKENFGYKFVELPLKNSGKTLVLEINTTLPPVNWTQVEKDIKTFLGNQINQYGIMVYDLKRNESLGINESTIFPPASSAKLTIAILVLRDIEAGKYTLDSTYPVQSKYKHSNFDTIGMLPEGTQVPIRKYLEELIIMSSNTAWYHLVHMLGDSYQVVNPRTIEELGVNPLFLDPYQATASNFVKIMKDVYYLKTLNENSRDYLFELMKNATQFNREGISLGIPSNIEFVNKLGYHWTHDLINFNDVAIVFGEKTDYAIAIIDENIDWTTGKNNLKEISRIVYTALNKLGYKISSDRQISLVYRLLPD
jgi:beta-lactamase class A